MPWFESRHTDMDEAEQAMLETEGSDRVPQTPPQGGRSKRPANNDLELKNMPLLDNPVTVIESHPDVAGEGVGTHRLPGSAAQRAKPPHTHPSCAHPRLLRAPLDSHHPPLARLSAQRAACSATRGTA